MLRTFPRQALALGWAAVLCAAAGVVSAAEVYRWVDENGVVNFTQQKPRDVEAEAYTTQGGAPRAIRQSAGQSADAGDSGEDAPEADELTSTQQEMLDRLQRQEQQRQDDIARVKAENCERSRSVLARLTVKDRIRVQGEDGYQRIMGEDERQSRIAEAQQGIARYCESA